MPSKEVKERDVWSLLREPFSIKALKFKPQSQSKDKQSALQVVFIDARDVSDRLDHVVGPGNWSFSVAPIQGAELASIIGTLSIKCGGDVIIKSDVGEDTTSKTSYKNAASDALKRCAVQFGMFRYAYDLKFPWAKNIAEPGRREVYAKPIVPWHYLPDCDKLCEECGATITQNLVDRSGKSRDGGEAICMSYYMYNMILCGECLGSKR